MAKLTEAKAEQVRGLCRKRLKFLCKEVLGMDQWHDPLHNQIELALDAPGNEKLFLVPRGHLKTSIVTVGGAIQQILRNPNIRILIMNGVWDFSRKVLWQIQDLLHDKSQLPAFFGPFNTPQATWTRELITVAQRNSAVAKEPTITTAGLETSLTGLHFDLVILDDLVNPENVTTREQKEKVLARYRDCKNLLDPGGKLWVVGTRYATDDLYGHILANESRSINGHVLKDAEERAGWRNYVKI
jgi:hypothetical protein